MRNQEHSLGSVLSFASCSVQGNETWGHAVLIQRRRRDSAQLRVVGWTDRLLHSNTWSKTAAVGRGVSSPGVLSPAVSFPNVLLQPCPSHFCLPGVPTQIWWHHERREPQANTSVDHTHTYVCTHAWPPCLPQPGGASYGTCFF